ncbi:calcium-activated chloride channel regulator 1-like [Tachypleus tridentatus]|uniref:calcium-activated chloride channel regulator 1-like n=1 Tax=Tachypleus tridentatus TaxID=6853 RepID=UPI003FD08C41
MNRYSFLRLFTSIILFTMVSAKITFEDGGYKGVVVAIHESLPEDEMILDNLVELFTNASQFLYNASRGHVFFKEVTVVIPTKWSSKPKYESIVNNPFNTATVRVDKPNPKYGNNPYTLQPGGCGEPGEYIHLTPEFLKELHGNTTEMYGSPDRQFVHEWSHLRYGVFDEYGIPGDPKYPMFYKEGGKVLPTTCMRNITGWIQPINGGTCTLFEDEFLEGDCTFVPDIENQSVKASLMYMPFIKSIDGYCDDTQERLHNDKAPTKQNILCEYKSTWEVISKHPDFSSPRSSQIKETKPTFRFLQRTEEVAGRFALVLDVSFSMKGRPIEILHEASSRLVYDFIPDESYLGIVSFGGESKISYPLTLVIPESRSFLGRSLPTSKDLISATSIGKGLIEGVRVLKNKRQPIEGSLIILITDGEENTQPWIREVLPILLREKVVVNAIALGNNATKKLENLATSTGGKIFNFFDINGQTPPNSLDSALLDSVTSQTTNELQGVQIANRNLRLAQSIVEEEVVIDNELGKNTMFTVKSNFIEVIDVTLKSPSGKIFNSTSPEYNRDNTIRKRIQVVIETAESGNWTVSISKSTLSEVSIVISVISEPKDLKVQPIRARAWISNTELAYPQSPKIFAEVKKEYSAVTGVTVFGTVESPSGSLKRIQLLDDGAGADINHNDGIYSSYFNDFDGNGRYAVVAEMYNEGNAKVKKGSLSSPAIVIPKLKNPKDRFTKPPANNFSADDFIIYDKKPDTEVPEEDELALPFQRITDAGSFRLENFNPMSGDVIPPSRIVDLKIISAGKVDDKNVVSLVWTSPGDDFDQGNATALEVRANIDFSNLLKNFDQSYLFSDNEIINGSLKPVPSRQKQILSVEIPDEAWMATHTSNTTLKDLYFAIKAVDENDNKAEVSNIGSAHFWKLTVPTKAKERLELWPVAVAVGGLIVLLAITAVSVYLFRKKSANPKSSCEYRAV